MKPTSVSGPEPIQVEMYELESHGQFFGYVTRMPGCHPDRYHAYIGLPPSVYTLGGCKPSARQSA
jgi:hypothetical protein